MKSTVGALLLTAWLAALAFAFQGARGLWDPDEGRYAIVAMNMLDSGDYLVPRTSVDHPHYAKPPLTYWAMAASLRALGPTELAVRLPNAIAFVLTGVIVTWMAQMLGVRRPWSATLIWATTLLPFVACNVATADTVLTFFETLAVAGFLAARWGSGRTTRQVGRWVMWIAFGCGFLTKGPPALIPLLAIVLFDKTASGARPLDSIYSPVPILAAMLIGLSWFVWSTLQHPHLLHYFLLYEFVYRVATDVHDRNPGFMGLIKVYGTVALVGMLPWSLILAWRALHEPRSVRSPSLQRHRDWKLRFLIYWSLALAVVFAVAQSRLPLYLLPLAVPFALLVTRSLERRETPAGTILFIATAASVSLIGMKYYSAMLDSPRDSRALAREFLRQKPVPSADELVFVEANPSYGLGFYLRKQVEAVGTAQPERESAFIAKTSLCEELTDRDRALLVVRHGREAEVARAAGRCRNARVEMAASLKQFALLKPVPRRG